MSQEFFWLALTVAMTGLIWVPYILDRVATRGLMGTLANPGPELPQQSDWAERMKAAHYNAVENLVVFAPLVLMLHALNISTGGDGGGGGNLFLGAARPPRGLHDGHSGRAHARLRGGLPCPGGAAACRVRSDVKNFRERINRPLTMWRHSHPRG